MVLLARGSVARLVARAPVRTTRHPAAARRFATRASFGDATRGAVFRPDLKQHLELYLVTSEESSRPGISIEEIVDAAIQGGITIVQLRMKEATTAEMLARARALQAITRFYNVPLIINDRLDVALAIGADGVHVGEDDLPVSVVRRLVGSDMLVGASAKTPDAVRAAQRAGADYVGCGAMYATPTKPSSPAIGLVGLRAVVTAAPGFPVVAIGGLDAATIPETIRAGAVGAAVVRYVMDAPDPAAASAVASRAIRLARAQTTIDELRSGALVAPANAMPTFVLFVADDEPFTGVSSSADCRTAVQAVDAALAALPESLAPAIMRCPVGPPSQVLVPVPTLARVDDTRPQVAGGPAPIRGPAIWLGNEGAGRPGTADVKLLTAKATAFLVAHAGPPRASSIVRRGPAAEEEVSVPVTEEAIPDSEIRAEVVAPEPMSQAVEVETARPQGFLGQFLANVGARA